jgi:hypothetical protein
MDKRKEKVVDLQNKLISRESILSKEHQSEVDQLIEENKVSVDNIYKIRS